MLIRSTLEPVVIEQRQVGNETQRFIKGYAAVFYKENEEGTQYMLWDSLVERIKKGAFKRAIKEKDDVRALFNHEPSMLLARIGNGLVLKEDDKGLLYEFPIDEKDIDHTRVVRKIERGDLSGSSFGFIAEERKFIEGKEGKPDVVEILSVHLFDVSPATYPAYGSTEVGLRSDIQQSNDELKKEYLKWKIESKETLLRTMYEQTIAMLRAKAGI